jgi:hypothetical protein
MGRIHNDVLDRGLGEIINTADFVHVCAWSPTDYGEIPFASLGAAPASFAAVNVAAGRQLQMPIFGGNGTKTGTATSWVVVDDATKRILAVDLLPSPIAVTQGATWALPGVAILLARGPAPPPNLIPVAAAPTLQSIAPGRGIGPRCTPPVGAPALVATAPTLSKTANIYLKQASSIIGLNRVAGCLYHFDGDMIDVANAHLATSVNISGSPSIALSTTRSKFGAQSLFFPFRSGGNPNNQCYLDGGSDFRFPNPGYWTIDFWIWIEPDVNQITLLDFSGLSFISNAPVISTYYMSSSAANRLSLGGLGFDGRGAGANVSASGWHHIALTFSVTTCYLFLDGALQFTHDCVGNNFFVGGNAPRLGDTYAGNGTLHGYMSELRILNGYCAWTANFTPASAPYTLADMYGANPPTVTRA